MKIPNVVFEANIRLCVIVGWKEFLSHVKFREVLPTFFKTWPIFLRVSRLGLSLDPSPTHLNQKAQVPHSALQRPGKAIQWMECSFRINLGNCFGS